LHLLWDLDSALGMRGVNSDVYAPDCAYSEILLAVPQFRAQYTQLLKDLMCGPFNEVALHAFIDALVPVLSSALDADPNNQLGNGSAADAIAQKKTWFSQRLQAVRAQVGAGPCGVTDVTHTAAPGLELTLRSNPARDRLTVALSLSHSSPARLELFDMSGRRIAERAVALGAGRHVVTLAEGNALPSGMYRLRLTQGARSITASAVVLR
jgi:hypothetical protein